MCGPRRCHTEAAYAFLGEFEKKKRRSSGFRAEIGACRRMWYVWSRKMSYRGRLCVLGEGSGEKVAAFSDKGIERRVPEDVVCAVQEDVIPQPLVRFVLGLFSHTKG